MACLRFGSGTIGDIHYRGKEGQGTRKGMPEFGTAGLGFDRLPPVRSLIPGFRGRDTWGKGGAGFPEFGEIVGSRGHIEHFWWKRGGENYRY